LEDICSDLIKAQYPILGYYRLATPVCYKREMQHFIEQI